LTSSRIGDRQSRIHFVEETYAAACSVWRLQLKSVITSYYYVGFDPCRCLPLLYQPRARFVDRFPIFRSLSVYCNNTVRCLYRGYIITKSNIFMGGKLHRHQGATILSTTVVCGLPYCALCMIYKTIIICSYGTYDTPGRRSASDAAVLFHCLTLKGTVALAVATAGRNDCFAMEQHYSRCGRRPGP